jgi:predicted nucleic acid-binding protein
MTGGILVDTGPLVAILARRDAYHEVCIEQLQRLPPPLFTCWPVITEAVWLLRRYPPAVQRLLGSFDTGLLRLLELDGSAIPWIARFLDRYRKLRTQVADAALVYLAEREGFETVFTLDRRDFSAYRLTGNRCLRLLPSLY